MTAAPLGCRNCHGAHHEDQCPSLKADGMTWDQVVAYGRAIDRKPLHRGEPAQPSELAWLAVKRTSVTACHAKQPGPGSRLCRLIPGHTGYQHGAVVSTTSRGVRWERWW